MKRVGGIPELTTKAKVLLGVTVFVLVAAVATFIAFSILTGQFKLGGESYDFKNKDTVTRQKDALSAADSALKSGDSSKAGDVYGQAIAAEPDKARKVELAISQSRMLYGSGKFDEAVEVAKKAESYNDDKFLITDWLGQLYEAGKRYDEAATYYTKAATLVGSPTNKGKYPKSFYDNQANRMKELAKKS